MSWEVRAAALRLLAKGLRESGVPGKGEEAAGKILQGMTKRGTYAMEAWGRGGTCVLYFLYDLWVYVSNV